MSHRLHLVVEVQVWQHEEEAEGVDTVDGTLNSLGIPRLVRNVEKRIYCSTCDERPKRRIHLVEEESVIAVRRLLGFGGCIELVDYSKPLRSYPAKNPS